MHYTMKFNLAMFIACIFLLNSCHKDIENEEIISTTVFTAQVVQEINGNILGYVIDENNVPVEGALVQIYSGSTTTNKYGIFTFQNTKLDKNGTYLTVRKAGYFLGSDMVYPEKAETYSSVKLMKLETGKSLDATKGGSIAITGGGTIDFPANAIVYKDGAAYNGIVNVSAKLLSPTDQSLNALMPGALVGDKKDKTTVVLGTAGMVAVLLQDQQGEELNLAANKKATITIPALSQAKPSTILLWSFDESLGRWVEEGIATLVNNNYVAEVSHFSFWNCDAPFPLVHVCGKLVDSEGNAIKNAWVQVDVEGLGTTYGSADSEGVFCGKMPKGKVLTIKISNSIGCNSILFTKEVGPFENNTQLDPFIIPLSDNKLILKGKVECNGTAVEDGILVVKAQQLSFPIRVKADGTFNENLSYLYCSGLTELNVFAYDQSTSVASNSATLVLNEDKTLTLNVCESGCPLEAAFNFDCNSVVLGVAITGGSGNYAYAWSNGKSTQSIELPKQDSLQQIFCVKVTDLQDNCTKEFCIEYGGKLFVYIDGWCSPTLTANPFGGFPPYTFLWNDGSTSRSIANPTAGAISVTITDSRGCTATGDLPSSGGPIFAESSPTYCNKNLFSLLTSNYTQAYIYTQNGVSITQPNISELDMYATGFNFNLLLSNGICERAFNIQLPQLKSMETIVTNTTCTTCSDGYITITTSADCLQCTLGDVLVLGEDKTSDYTASNAAKTLKSGLYYVVAKDKITGCYIAISKVNIK